MSKLQEYLLGIDLINMAQKIIDAYHVFKKVLYETRVLYEQYHVLSDDKWNIIITKRGKYQGRRTSIT